MTGLIADSTRSADITAITQVILTERESRDLAHWKRMEACFHADARIRLSWIDGSPRDFVDGSIDMAKRGMKATHRLSPATVRVNGDRAVVNMSSIIDIPGTVKGVEVYLSSYGRFLYRVERRDGRWAILNFDALYLRDELTAAIPGQPVPVTPEDVAEYRPSYRMLCFMLAQTGYVPYQTLPGFDRPETVQAMMDEAFGWAGLTADSADLSA